MIMVLSTGCRGSSGRRVRRHLLLSRRALEMIERHVSSWTALPIPPTSAGSGQSAGKSVSAKSTPMSRLGA